MVSPVARLPLLLLLLLGLLAGSACQTVSLREAVQRREFVNLLDSVVRIDVRERSFENGREQVVSGVGSGVILSPEGHVLTNAHVVTGRAIEISVTLASLERVHARFIGWDHWTDLALIQLDMEEVRRRGLAFASARFGDSERLYPGQTVFAVGTPNGLTRTVSRGIISNTSRYFEGADGVRGYETGYFNTWLQTDAAINPGNSGGPLVTEDGRVVGINTRGYLGSNNLGFAVPSATAQEVVRSLLATGEVVRSYIGVVSGPLQDLESFYEIDVNQGMLVASVDPGSPADRAGLRAGDLLLSLNGAPLDGRFPEQLPPIRNRIATAPVGSGIEFGVRRGPEVLPVRVVTERLESRVGEDWAFQGWGLSVRTVSRAFAREQKLPDDGGFIVLGTQRAFPAAEARLQPGDVILKVNRQKVETLEALKAIYEASREDKNPLLLEVSRNHSLSLLVLRP
jgi:serine protease Do